MVMTSNLKTLSATFGFLRLGLLTLAITSMLIPTIEWVVIELMGELPDYSFLSLGGGLIAPVMAPVLIVVILLDVIMAKVRAADDPTASGDQYRMISRVESFLILIMLMFWIPFFYSLTS
jgi:hypothetical protein